MLKFTAILTPFRWLVPTTGARSSLRAAVGAQSHLSSHLPLEEAAQIPGLVAVRPPQVFDANYLLELGHKVVQWLASRWTDSLEQAWKAVQQFIAQNSQLVWRAIRTHPYITSVGVVTVAAATLVYLLRRKIEEFARRTAKHIEMNLAQALDKNNDGTKGLEWELIPEGFSCPITLTIMRDPVITPSGHTYERDALVKWISDKGTEPTTRQPLSMDNLIPNRSLRDAILRWEQCGAPY